MQKNLKIEGVLNLKPDMTCSILSISTSTPLLRSLDHSVASCYIIVLVQTNQCCLLETSLRSEGAVIYIYGLRERGREIN